MEVAGFFLPGDRKTGNVLLFEISQALHTNDSLEWRCFTWVGDGSQDHLIPGLIHLYDYSGRSSTRARNGSTSPWTCFTNCGPSVADETVIYIR